MMMNTSGNSAMFMMENMMNESPEMMTQVMDNFMHQEFDVFSHMAEPVYDPAMTLAVDPMTGMPNTEMPPDYDPNIEGPAAGIVGTVAITADPAMTAGYNPAMDAMRALQADVIGTMMDHGGAKSMETMAYMMSAGDATTSALILESVMDHSMPDTYGTAMHMIRIYMVRPLCMIRSLCMILYLWIRQLEQAHKI